MARTVILVVLAFLAGVVAVYFVVLFGTLFYWEFAGIRDRDGGGAMGLAFVIAPFFGVLGGLGAAVLAGWRLTRAGAGSKTPLLGPWARVALAMTVAALIGHGLGSAAVWILIGPGAGSLAMALIASWAPVATAAASAALAYWLVAKG